VDGHSEMEIQLKMIPKSLQPFTMSTNKLQCILNHLLMSQVKLKDAPASSQTHFDYAIVELQNLVGEYEIQDTECKQVLNDALEHMKIYRLYGFRKPRLD